MMSARLEPDTSSVREWCNNQLHHRGLFYIIELPSTNAVMSWITKAIPLSTVPEYFS